MKNMYYAGMIAALVFACARPSAAEDIDLFVQPAGASATTAPNVLIVLDSTANWNTPFTEEMSALSSTVNSLAVNADGTAKFRLGLMLFTETGGGNSNVDGGYVRAAIRDLTAANKAKYVALVNSLNKNSDVSNGGKASKALADAWQYFSGLAPRTGNNKNKTDYTGNNTGTVASNAIYALPGNALNSKAGSPYNSPIANGSCGKNYIIYISNNAVQDNSSDTATATGWLTASAAAEGITGATSTIPISPSGSQSNVADEWARFMHRSSKGIVTYTVDVNKVTTGQGPGWTALLKSMANVSNGHYYDVNSNIGGQIGAALAEIFSKIQSVNSVFASVSLPVSVNTEGTYLNQVYIGEFRPDADAFPRWAGNLKQYKLKVVGSVLKTVDAYEYPDTINPLTGFIDRCARAFWTPTSMDAYWTFKPAGDCDVIPAIDTTPAETLTNSANSNRPDGNIVEKGAQAYVLRSSTTRTVKTCSSTFATCASSTTLLDFNNSNVSQTDLGAASTTERDALITWARGLDVDDENTNGVTATTTPAEMRPSAHGDVVHSRPVALNFGTDVSPKVMVFYAGNDGVLRAINGNRGTAIGSVAAGQEAWAFIPPEFFTSIKRIRDNTVQINYVGNPTTTPTPLPKPYGIDGPLTVFRDATRTWIFGGMRRGGRALYAFNVTDIAAATPVAPTLLWKRGCPNLGNDTGCSTNYTGLGQTWSAPVVFTAAGYVGGSPSAPKPMLFMGGGYDTCEDADPNTCTSSSKGNHIYVIDAETGTRLQVFDTDRPVVGDVFVIPDSTTGLAKWAYAADAGGNLYRISGANATTPFSTTDPSTTPWTITKIASLGCATASGSCANRKFLFAPDVVNENGTMVILVGSGDREKPLRSWTSAYGVNNYFFMVRDNPTDPNWLTNEFSRCTANMMCLASLTPILSSSDPTASDLAGKNGWYLGMVDHEQVVTSAITVFGTTTFSTHTPVPATPSCISNLGTARVYNVAYKNAATQNGTNNRSQQIAGGGLPPSPVAGMVTLDDGSTVPFLIGGDPDSPLQSLLPTGPVVTAQPKAVTFYYIHK